MVEFLDRTLYPGQSNNWDDRLFRDCVLPQLNSSAVVLDLGAGAGIVQQMNFKGLAAKICGVDLDPRVMSNPFLDEGKLSGADAIPYADATFDVVIADNVVEHLADPQAVFREVCRVLRPGGVFLFKTPNRLHYMPTIARLTPHRFHQIVNKWRGRSETDTFPTLYRANTAEAINRFADGAGLKVDWQKRIEGRPEYLRISWLTYLIGAVYERLVNAWECLARFRILLIVRLRKPGGNEAALQS